MRALVYTKGGFGQPVFPQSAEAPGREAAGFFALSGSARTVAALPMAAREPAAAENRRKSRRVVMFFPFLAKKNRSSDSFYICRRIPVTL